MTINALLASLTVKIPFNKHFFKEVHKCRVNCDYNLRSGNKLKFTWLISQLLNWTIYHLCLYFALEPSDLPWYRRSLPCLWHCHHSNHQPQTSPSIKIKGKHNNLFTTVILWQNSQSFFFFCFVFAKQIKKNGGAILI